MSLNSIDFVTMLPRTAEAANLQGREMNQLQHAAEQTAVQFQQKNVQEAKQTVETQKSETEEYDMDGSSGGTSQQKNAKKRKKEKNEAPMAPRSNSSFDIMI